MTLDEMAETIVAATEEHEQSFWGAADRRGQVAGVRAGLQMLRDSGALHVVHGYLPHYVDPVAFTIRVHRDFDERCWWVDVAENAGAFGAGHQIMEAVESAMEAQTFTDEDEARLRRRWEARIAAAKRREEAGAPRRLTAAESVRSASASRADREADR